MSKSLVAFFSASGITKTLAERLANVTGSDIFEIVPAKPYTETELNYKNPASRCNKEKLLKKDVPVAGKIQDFDAYDTVYIGFPIWYFCAPNVVNTFVKDYDWTGKKIYLFATSGGSDMGKTSAKLKPYLNGNYEIVSSKRFSASASSEELKEWAE